MAVESETVARTSASHMKSLRFGDGAAKIA